MAYINGYTLLEPPYKGGMALVYKGQKGAFSRAFKMVRPDKAVNNPKLCQRFLKEIQLQTKLEHPNIIKILDAYPYTDNKGVTVTILEMEWLNGLDLQRYVEKHAPRGLDRATITKIAMQVIDGLEYAHNHSILHLDIKPSNIFRTVDGYIKIIDFGIARVVGENAEIVEGASKVTIVNETGESTFKGTLAFSSPEQQVGGRLSFASDIYSFGKTLHFLSTGTTDPSAEVEDEMLSQIISKCTIQNPKHRYQTFGEVRNAFAPQSENIKCPNCGSAVSKTAKFCSECGFSLLSKPAGKTEKCPSCGKPRSGTDRFCDNCGHEFNSGAQKPVAEKCPSCGKPRSGNDRFCDNCGHEFNSGAQKPVAEKCPSCGKINYSNDRFCDNCGWDFNSSVKDANKPKLVGFKCNKCNKITKLYSDGVVNFCNHCGSKNNYLTPIYE